MATTTARPVASRRGWDPLIRITHWGVAVAVLINGLITDGGSGIHVWIGYVAVALLVLRLVWGLIGTDEARFSSFPPSLSAAVAHSADLVAGRSREYRSHNPLGSLMVYALWGTLTVVAATGIAMAGSPLQTVETASAVQLLHEAGEQDGDREYDDGHGEHGPEILNEIHEVAANLLLMLAALHVAGVAFESRIAGRNLAREMVTGDRSGQRDV